MKPFIAGFLVPLIVVSAFRLTNGPNDTEYGDIVRFSLIYAISLMFAKWALIPKLEHEELGVYLEKRFVCSIPGILGTICSLFVLHLLFVSESW